ncbi:MAG TPA: FlgD immunoglobulin-like domain containing protein [Candidatus Krumholzibacteria bacterium]|nr:FlgD immunoglobulin-like domain containing protein [Candidatus Krumholzibacteria bacterium]HPD71246.1 FlgD immunoglobulin-like domain containing protein [Candidatus Krumholzibacteria bacterium]HRY39054.1 FlgD immunoglobulin-like domain containing protein [Candidatus Krumholzibacteria bacterium]
MKRFVLFATLALALVLAASALATERQYMVRGGWGTLNGEAVQTAKALGDTIYLLGNPQNPDQAHNGTPPASNGTFQDQFGNPTWNGWTHADLTYSPDSYWQVSNYLPSAGSYSMWCGTTFDGDAGYGNDWSQNLVFTYTVANPGQSSVVHWTSIVDQDSEPAYDFTYVEWNQGGVWVELGAYDGNRVYNIDFTFTYNPGDYVGSNNNQIQLRYRFSSDGAWSDEDGLWDTEGAVRVDNIIVQRAGVTINDENFEDQVSQAWLPVLDPGVGDFAAIYTNLLDADPCVSNFGPQVAFIDNGTIVPGTGGYLCTTWCYGPGSYIVNPEGGLMGPNYYINNIIISPVLPWPAGNDGCQITFGVYRHEELGAVDIWPGMFYQWHVRSVASGNPADLAAAPWRNRNFVQYGGPDYTRQAEVVTDLLENGRTHMQLSLRVIEYGYVWGWVGTDGTPAPYLDNAQVKVYPFLGPGISTRDIDIANDNFPDSGDLDFVTLTNNVVRFDMANNIANADNQVNDPGDTIFFDVTAVRTGSVLHEMPKLHVRMKANPLFTVPAIRQLPANFTRTPAFFPDGWDLIEGWVYGDSTFNVNGGLVANRYNFDLPDGEVGEEKFFYPGDVIHFYCEAKDNLGGNIGTTILPGDTSGYASFVNNLDYDSDFIINALPTMFSATEGDQPPILFWNDFGDRGGENEWLFALQQLGFKEGVDYDTYYTTGPSSGVGNGLGGRATSAQLRGYSTLLYTAGDLSVNLLANGDFNNDPSDDLNVVTNWFGQGDKNAFMTGDDLIAGLLDAGAQGSAFVNSYISVNFVDTSILSFIQNQTAPVVQAINGNGVIVRVPEWIAFGGCLGINTFDAITTTGTAVSLAEFLDPNGNAGAYPYTAAVLNVRATENARVVVMPYDFMFIYNAPGYTPPIGYGGISARAVILEDILDVFGEQGTSNPIGVGETPGVVSVSNYPNPFNPKTTIMLNLPKTGDVSLKVYNVRGELVRTLIDGPMEAGSHRIEWNGDNDQGSRAPSGVYFYETQANGKVLVNKMALVK